MECCRCNDSSDTNRSSWNNSNNRRRDVGDVRHGAVTEETDEPSKVMSLLVYSVAPRGMFWCCSCKAHPHSARYRKHNTSDSDTSRQNKASTIIVSQEQKALCPSDHEASGTRTRSCLTGNTRNDRCDDFCVQQMRGVYCLKTAQKKQEGLHPFTQARLGRMQKVAVFATRAVVRRRCVSECPRDD